jgi:hypothetical protein
MSSEPMGYPVEDAPNRKGVDPVKPCPKEKVSAIKQAVWTLSK